MDLEQARKIEHQKYAKAYTSPDYRMHGQRMIDAQRDLAALPVRGSYLDVSCGRGDMLVHAAGLGFAPVVGTEIVPALLGDSRVCYSEAHALPFEDKSYSVVTMFDVIEHLIPGDDELACRELLRVALNHIIITANNRASVNRLGGGDVLHINRRPYDEWDGLFREWFAGADVTQIKASRDNVSQTWRVDL